MPAAGAARAPEEPRGRPMNRGKVDPERRTAAELGHHVEMAGHVAHGRHRGGDAEPGAAARGLGGEERLSDTPERCLVHPAARVPDGEHEVAVALGVPRDGTVAIGEREAELASFAAERARRVR